jgi:dTDP-4-dehydrorhamnose 3,5-epimerase
MSGGHLISRRLALTQTPLAGLVKAERRRMGDERGFLARLFCAEELAEAGWHGPIAQINHSRTTTTGAVRGLHFQRPPHAEMKLVSCVRGAVWDVAVNVRAGSADFLRWHGEVLSADNGVALLIPEGFAHGFQALTPEVELIYCHSTPFVPEAEAGLHPCDPRLAIAWPLAVGLLSARDARSPLLETTPFEGVRL